LMSSALFALVIISGACLCAYPQNGITFSWL
jgi:hypothetical protein